MTCSTLVLDSGVCYTHSANNPVTRFHFQNCPNGEICDLNLTDSVNHMAFYNSSNQHRTYSSLYERSSVYNKVTSANCISRNKFKTNLLAGRHCHHNSQCYTRQCHDGVCIGKYAGNACSSSKECNVGLTCMHSQEYPFETKCMPLRDLYDVCYEDSNC